MNLEELVKEAAQARTNRSPLATAIGEPTAHDSQPTTTPADEGSKAQTEQGEAAAVAVADPSAPNQQTEQARPVKERPNVAVEVASSKKKRKTGPDQGQIVAADQGQRQSQGQAKQGSLLVPVRQPHEIDHAHGAVSLIIASFFGLVLVGRAWFFGAETTVEFLNDWLGWTIPISIPLDIQQLRIRFNLDLVWLFPIGLTFYQMVHRPPLSFKGIIRHVRRDPAGSSLWLIFTTIGIGTTFGGLILWSKDRHWIIGPRIVLEQWPLLMIIFFSALAVEYLAEPFAIKFWAEFNNGLKALFHKWDAEAAKPKPAAPNPNNTIRGR